MQEEIKTAVEWWKQQLSELPAHDAGDSALNMVLLLSEADNAPNKPEYIEAFGETLTRLLQTSVEQQKAQPLGDSPYLFLATDYSPEKLLLDAAREAHVHGFPVKTWMNISPGKVIVSKGYGRKPVRLYPPQN